MSEVILRPGSDAERALQFRRGTEEGLTYPELRGNGVMASLANIDQNPHIGILLVDFVRDVIGLHINGAASVVDDAAIREQVPGLPLEQGRGQQPQRWVVVHVQEAYVHCRKHIPRMLVLPRRRAWGTDDKHRKGGDFFGVAARATNATSP